MAKTHSNAKSNHNKTQKTERHYTVGYVPQNGKLNPPSGINLKGRWLEELKFFSGKSLIVTTEKGKIIIMAELQV